MGRSLTRLPPQTKAKLDLKTNINHYKIDSLFQYICLIYCKGYAGGTAAYAY